MNKLTKTILSSTLLATTIFAQSELSKTQLKELENLNIFKKFKITLIKGVNTDSVYILNVKLKNNIDTIYLTKDKKYLISGNVLDVNNGAPLTMPIDMSILKDHEAFTFGTGSDEYVLFTDPECPYCKKFESYLAKIEDKVKIRVFYYPLNFHKNAYDLSIYIMSQKTLEDKIKTMINTNANSENFKNRKINEKVKKELSKKLDKQIELASELEVGGTPSLFNNEGNKLSWVNMLKKYGINVE